MIKLSAIIFYSALFISGIPESSMLSIIGNKPAVLKTSNGCWDVNHFVVNRGDSILRIPATIGYISSNLEYFPSDTLVSYHLLDFNFPDISSQGWLNGGTEKRYFAAATENFIYLYSTSPTFDDDPEIIRTDSLATPSGFTTLFVKDLDELLVVNRQDSINYAYSFYDLPGLTIDLQVVINIKPEKIIYGSFPGTQDCYLISGSENGESKLLVIRANDHQVISIIPLPDAAGNTKEIIDAYTDFYFLSSPGDTLTNVIKLHLADTIISVFQVLPFTGIHASTIYEYNHFIIQTIADTSQNELHKQLLVIDVSGEINDTLWVSKRASSLHFNPEFYYDEHFIALGEESAIPNDWVYFYDFLSVSAFDSLQAGAAPTWFAEDFRCYIGIEEIEKNLAIKVYPNPADEQVNIQITGLAKGKTYYFDISDESGKIIWSREILSKQEYSIPLQQFPKGLLLFRVNAGTKVVTKKILKL